MRHVTTRYIPSQSSDVLCRACRTARCDTLVTTSATRTIRVQGHRQRVDTSLFPKVDPEIDANPEHKTLNLYTRALLLLCRPPCRNKHGATRTTRATRHVTTRHSLLV